MRLQSFVIGSLAACVAGHGSLWFPKPRNQYNSNSCPHCANGGGVCGGGGQWTSVQSQVDEWMGTYTSLRTYLTAGGTVDAEYYITAPHVGHFVMEICYWDGSATSITDSCFQRLERDPSSTTYSPYNPDKPDIAYFPANDCAKLYNSSKKTMKTRFKVPNKTADRAVLRWYWQTGNSCISDGSVSAGNVDSSLVDWTLDGCGVATSSSSLRPCGTDCPHASCAAESFKNCADVMVVSGGSSNVDSDNAQIEGSAPIPTSAPTTSTPATTTSTPATTTSTTATTTSTTASTTSTQAGEIVCTLPPECNTEPTEVPSQPPTSATTSTTATTPSTMTTQTDDECIDYDPIKYCEANIAGKLSHYDAICKELCGTFADTQGPYCSGHGYPQTPEGLLGCVVYAYGSACEMLSL